MTDMTEIEIALNNFELAARWIDADNYGRRDTAELDKRLANRDEKRRLLMDLIRKAVKND